MGDTDEATPARILIADDHALVREGLRTMPSGEHGLEVISEARDGQQALTLCRALRPHLVLRLGRVEAGVFVQESYGDVGDSDASKLDLSFIRDGNGANGVEVRRLTPAYRSAHELTIKFRVHDLQPDPPVQRTTRSSSRAV